MQITKINLIYLFVAMGCLNSALVFGADKSDDLTRHEKTAALIEVAYNYLKFVHDVGSAKSVQDNDIRLQTLFAPKLTKTDNHSVLFKNNRDLLLPQMKGFEKTYNPEAKRPDWTIDLDNVQMILSAETNTVVAYFQWNHINIGHATTMAILKVNDDNQITHITDVWAKIKE